MKIKLLTLLAFLSQILNATEYLSFSNGYEEKGSYTVEKKATKYLDYIEVEYNFDGAYLNDYEVGNKIYKQIKMNGASYVSSKGEPELPTYIDFLITNSEQCDIEIVDAQYEEYDGIVVKSSQGIMTFFDKEDSTLTFSENYSIDAYYPKNNAEIIMVNKYKSMPYLSIQVNPIQYNPKASKIRCYKSISFKVTSKDGTWSGLNYDTYDELSEILADNAIDPVDKTGIERPKRAPVLSVPKKMTGTNYLIVTSDDLLPQVNRLVKWKTIQGFPCHVISKEKWSSNQEVASEIESFYRYEKPDYLLIFGDHENVPSNEFRNYDYWIQEYGLDSIYLSDLPYAGGSLLIPHMIPGRISVSDTTFAKNAVDKILDYERYPTADDVFYNTATHCSYAQDDTVKGTGLRDGYEDGLFVYTSEKIRNYMMGWGKTINREYRSDYYPSRYSMSYANGIEMPSDLLDKSSWTGNADNIVKDINDGSFYVIYNAHGWYDSWGNLGFSVWDVLSLNNIGKYPVVFSISCLTGGFHQDCLAELFLLKENGGSVGVVASSTASYFHWNDALLIGMFNTMFTLPGIENIHTESNYQKVRPETTFEMGRVLRSGLRQMYHQGFKDTAALNLTCREYHYFGDPSMEIYTETPACFNPTITQDGTTVTVNTGGVSGCKIVLSSALGDEILVFKGSEATFTNVTYPYNVYISKHNYKPYVWHKTEYLQNEEILIDKEILGENITVGRNVTSTMQKGDVVVRYGAKLSIIAQNRVRLESGFKTTSGKLLIHKGETYDCPFGYNEPISVFTPVTEDPTQGGSGNGENIAVEGPSTTELDDIQDSHMFIGADGNTLTITFKEPTDVQIFDILGRKVFQTQNLLHGSVSLSQGLYLVQHGKSIRKVLID